MPTISLNTILSPTLSTSVLNVGVKQFKRTYNGLCLNFPKIYEEIQDIKTKNCSNFYLTPRTTVDSGFYYDNSTLKSINIKTPIKYGTEYLQFSRPTISLYKTADKTNEIENYGTTTFSLEENDSTIFNIKLNSDNKCQIYYQNGNKKYFLVADINNKLSFAIEKLIPTTSEINPHDFLFMYSEPTNSLLFFKRTGTGNMIVTKTGNSLALIPNIVDEIAVPFTISRTLFQNLYDIQNTSFVSYTNDNLVDSTRSMFNLYNNILLHKPINTQTISPIVLKNQLLQDDVFSCANNLLSSATTPEYSDNLREYTSIFEDITEETTDELELNYVFYNKAYKIFPGTTTFTAPSSLYPYNSLNINDSTLKHSGAFAFPIPQYADKVYQMYKDNNLDSQHLLCTWLSGNPGSNDAIWVDRYYYPDLISKEAALIAYAPLSPTYDDYIETLIQTNSVLKEDVKIRKFFDKKSDLVFESDAVYKYERISTSTLPSLSSNITLCTGYSPNYPVNYFKTLNQANQFTFGFYFEGNDSNWVVYSEKNTILSGVSFEKSKTTLKLTYSILDTTTNLIHTWSKTVNIKPLKTNFVLYSMNGLTGKCYFYLNNEIIYEFSIPRYQFTYKKITYGDFFIQSGDNVQNIFESHPDINTPYVSSEFLDQNLAFIKPIIDGKMKIDDLYIALPCGMRNSTDNVEYLQNVQGISLFKSNSIDIIIKNTNLESSDIMSDLKESVESNISSLPINSNIRQIEYKNYK